VTRLLWHGQTLELFPEKALFWQERKTLLITDSHFGKAAFFRSRGIPVPENVTAADLARLDGLIERTAAERLVILGDFFHAKGGRARQTLQQMKAWRDARETLEILLIRGNHDEHAGDPPRSWKIKCVNAGFLDPPFVFAHEPDPHPEGYVLAGHVHPAVSLTDVDGSCLRLPCFSFGEKVGLLPSFGSFTGSWTITPGRRDRIFAVGAGEVVEVS
jgi:DNA ligase-associated metallophosphoesterase